jgi:hypothetical protein
MREDDKQQSWVSLAIQLHGEKYDYSKVEFINSKTPVTVICKIHGAWQCQPSLHTSKNKKRGCPACGGSQKKTTEQFILEANIKHEDAYDYTQVKYVNSHTNVEIICPKHGSFNQSPTSHLTKSGCPDCSKVKRLEADRQKSVDSIQKRLLEKTSGGVQMVEATFEKINAEATFICIKHGEFTRNVNTALYNSNTCLECFKESDSSNIREQHDVELNLNKKLKDGITYEPFVYIGSKKTSIKLNCPAHGQWNVLYGAVVRNGVNCPKCVQANAMPKRIASIKAKNIEKQDFHWSNYLAKFKAQHGETYDYSLASFVNAKTPIKIKCSIHGTFEQTPDMHIRSGCRMCADEELAGIYNKRFFEIKPELADVPAILYLLKLTWNEGTCFKIGITRTTLKRRFGAALGKGVHIEVLRVVESKLIDAWKDEVKFLSTQGLQRFEEIDKDFARKARISPSELFVKLPDEWEKIMQWTMTEPYQLN